MQRFCYVPACHGLRRQSGSGDGAFGGRGMSCFSIAFPKAGSRCACPRSPNSPTPFCVRRKILAAHPCPTQLSLRPRPNAPFPVAVSRPAPGARLCPAPGGISRSSFAMRTGEENFPAAQPADALRLVAATQPRSGAFGGRGMSCFSIAFPKAGSRCACPRSPNSPAAFRARQMILAAHHDPTQLLSRTQQFFSGYFKQGHEDNQGGDIDAPESGGGEAKRNDPSNNQSNPKDLTANPVVTNAPLGHWP